MSGQLSPQVSIITPTRNRCDLLQQTLSSVLAQTCGAWEAVVVDDGSSDGTAEMMGALCAHDPRVRYACRDGGPPGANRCRNQGFQMARGEYVMFLDSDDLLDADCLRRRVGAMEAEPGMAFAVFGMGLFRTVPGDRGRVWNILDTPVRDLDRFLDLEPPWSITGPIWRKAYLASLQAGGSLWDETLPSFQEWDLNLRALLSGALYSKHSRIDSYCRRSGQDPDQTNRHCLTPDHLRSHEVLFARTWERIQSSDMVGTDTPERVAGLFFWLAGHWAAAGNTSEARRVWSLARSRHLVSAAAFAEGIAYLLTSERSLARRVASRYLRQRWPETLRMKQAAAFHKGRLPVDVRDAEECPLAE